MKRYSKFILVLLLFTIIVPALPVEAETGMLPGKDIDNVSLERLAGNGRVETSIEVSKEVYPRGSAKNVVLAGYNGEVDALTGTLLAAKKDGPLLLVSKQGYKQLVKELERLGVENIFLLGGEGIISRSIKTSLEKEGYKVKRVAGANRLETAIAIAEETSGRSRHVFLANDGRGGSLADALSSGPVSGRDQKPILLTAKDKLPDIVLDSLEDLKVENITIVGGRGVVSESIRLELEEKGYNVERISGSTREKTAREVAEEYFKSPKKAILANDGRKSFADALVGGYLGAKIDGPILLTGVDSLRGESVRDYLKYNIENTYVLGGASVVSENTFKSIGAILRGEYLEAEEESKPEPDRDDGLSKEDRFVNKELNRIVKSSIKPNMSEFDQVRVLYDYLVDNVTYSFDTETSPHSVYTLLNEKKGVCQAYALAFGRLLDEIGIENYYTTGSGGLEGKEEGWEGHAWNKVKLGNQWYNIDSTWGSPEGHSKRYGYFMQSDKVFSKTHKERYPNLSPKAASTKYDSYFYSKSVKLYNKEDLSREIVKKLDSKSETLDIAYFGEDVSESSHIFEIVFKSLGEVEGVDLRELEIGVNKVSSYSKERNEPYVAEINFRYTRSD